MIVSPLVPPTPRGHAWHPDSFQTRQRVQESLVMPICPEIRRARHDSSALSFGNMRSRHRTWKRKPRISGIYHNLRLLGVVPACRHLWTTKRKHVQDRTSTKSRDGYVGTESRTGFKKDLQHVEQCRAFRLQSAKLVIDGGNDERGRDLSALPKNVRQAVPRS